MKSNSKVKQGPEIQNEQIEIHPYGLFANSETKKMIIGTFPAPEFTTIPPKIDPKTMIDFYYGRTVGRGANQLWKLLGDVFGYEMDTADKVKAILQYQKIGVADICKRVTRKIPGDASDKNLEIKEWNIELCDFLKNNETIETLLFTSKNAYDWYSENLKEKVNRLFEEVILLSPSKAANLYIAGLKDYKNGSYHDVYAYRLERYKEAFLGPKQSLKESKEEFEKMIGTVKLDQNQKDFGDQAEQSANKEDLFNFLLGNSEKTSAEISIPDEVKDRLEQAPSPEQMIKDILLTKHAWINFKDKNKIESYVDLLPHFNEISTILYFWAMGTLKVQEDALKLTYPDLQENSIQNWDKLLPNVFLIVDSFLENLNDDRSWDSEAFYKYFTSDREYLGVIAPMLMLFFICDAIRFEQ